MAVDIGGTKLAAGLVDSEGRILARSAAPTPRTDDAEVVFAALAGLLDEVGAKASGALGCGIGSGGPMTAGGEALTPVHIPAWRGFPLRRRMEEATGLAVFVDNDAKAVALAEGSVGAAVGVHAFVGMVVSMGWRRDRAGRAGCSTEAGNAGHIGHVVVEPGGRAWLLGGQGLPGG